MTDGPLSRLPTADDAARRVGHWLLSLVCRHDGWPCRICVLGNAFDPQFSNGWGTPLLLLTEAECFHPTNQRCAAFQAMVAEEMAR